MAGGKNKGKMKGIRPKTARPNFKKGEEAARAAGRKGGEGQRRRWARIRTLRAAAEAIRNMPLLDKHGKDTGFTEGVAATIAMYKAAQAGDSKAYKVLAELMGEMEQTLTLKEIPHLVDDV